MSQPERIVILENKSLASAAALVAAVVLGGLVLFQLALALGVPWGEASYGGAEATLPTHLRATSLAAVVFWSLVIFIVLRRGGHQVWSPFPVAWLPVAAWALVGLMVIACVVNALTPSAIERAIWLPVSVTLLVTLVTVQVTADH